MKKELIAICSLLLLNPVLSQTNGYVGFSIYIDREAPVYSDYELINSIINAKGESFTINSYWSDNNRLKSYEFETNLSGSYVNESGSFIDDWANITKTINNPLDEGKVIDVKVHAVDGSGNWNNTQDTVTIASIIPDYHNVSQDSSNPTAGDLVNISSYWIDNFEVDSVYLQTNETGSWLNNGSPVNINSQEGWGNITIDTTGMSGEFYYRLMGYDAIGNSNTTPINYFIVQ